MLRRGARVAVAALLAGCAAAPYTRRSQLILISPEEENKLGARAFQQVLGKSHVDGRAQVNGAVEAVGQRLAAPFTCARPSTDRKSTRLNSSHTVTSYAVFRLKKKISTVSCSHRNSIGSATST